MNEYMIRTYCKVIAENGNMILFMEDGDPFMTAENLKTGEMWSCHSLEEFDMLCEL